MGRSFSGGENDFRRDGGQNGTVSSRSEHGRSGLESQHPTGQRALVAVIPFWAILFCTVDQFGYLPTRVPGLRRAVKDPSCDEHKAQNP